MITTQDHVFFYSGQEIYSNWHTTVKQFFDPRSNLTWEHSEGAFMYYKALFFHDFKIAKFISEAKDARHAKELGRSVKGYHDKSWECVRFGFMTYVCYLKFSQNPEWRDKLKNTQNRILVEASPVDAIWGVNMDIPQAFKFTEEKIANGILPSEIPWVGKNLLGKALMEVRKML